MRLTFVANRPPSRGRSQRKNKTSTHLGSNQEPHFKSHSLFISFQPPSTTSTSTSTTRPQPGKFLSLCFLCPIHPQSLFLLRLALLHCCSKYNCVSVSIATCPLCSLPPSPECVLSLPCVSVCYFFFYSFFFSSFQRISPHRMNK